MIRAAVNGDIPQIIKVVKEAHKESSSKGVPLDEEIIRKNVQVCILSAEHLVNVVEIVGVIEGVFIGVTSGIGDMDRTKKLYEKLGAVRVGDSYVLPKEN